MRAGWYLARSELRRTWKGALAVMLLLGTLWGLTIGFAVGARRNATAFERMVVATRPIDILVNAQYGAGTALDFDAVTHLPEVAEYDGIDGYFAAVNSDDPNSIDNGVLWLSLRRGTIGRQFERMRLIAGRQLNLGRADETLVNPEFTRRYHLRVGDRFTFSVFDPAGNTPTVAGRHRMRIVGVFRMSDESVKEGGAGGPRTIMTPAFYRDNKQYVGYWSPAIRLKPGTDIERFKRTVNAMIPSETIVYQTLPGVRRDVDRSNRPQVLALVAFSIILGTGTLLATLQLLTQVVARRNDRRHNALDGLGAPAAVEVSAHRFVLAPLLAASALLAVTVAVFISAGFPVGVVRRIEIHPRTNVHLIGLAIGVLVPVVFVFGATEWFSRRRLVHRAKRPPTAPSLGAAWPLALAARSARRAPRLLAATTVAASLAVAGLVFTASLGSFASTPARFGWRWDAIVQNNGPDPSSAAVDVLRAYDRQAIASYAGLRNVPGLAAASIIRSGQMPIGRAGAIINVVGFQVLHGDAVPQIVTGRMPSALGEIAIGPRIARTEHVRLGDTIAAGDGRTATQLRVVGTVALPGLGFYSGNDSPPVGGSAVTTIDQFVKVIAPGANTYAVVRYNAGLSMKQGHAAVATALGRTEGGGVEVTDTVRRNVDVVALAAIRRTPMLLVLTLTVLTLATLAQALFAESRRGRQTLAVLSVLGASPHSLGRLVRAHALLVVASSMVSGCALGVVLGRLAWSATAHSVGVLPGHVLPLLRLALAVIAAFLLGWLAAWWPARSALRGRPAGVLRAE